MSAQTLTCHGPSQWPLIRHRCEITYEPARQIRPGDLVVVRQENAQVCHRALRKRGDYWLVKGDANRYADGWVEKSRIKGRVVAINGRSVDRFSFRALSLLLRLVSTAQSYWNEPPLNVGLRLQPHRLDYGHALFYEDFFGQNGDEKPITSLVQEFSGPVLDLAGGGGRLSEALVRAGNRVALLDNSQAMLAKARWRKSRMGPEEQARFTILEQDMRTPVSAEKFGVVFALANGFEHLLSEAEIIASLEALKSVTLPHATCFIEVHRLEFWEKTAGWCGGYWEKLRGVYRAGERRYQVWSRERRDGKFITQETAITHRGIKFTLMSSNRLMLSVPTWEDLFARAGWKLVGKYGNWYRQPLLDHHAYSIFEIKK